MEHKIFRVFKIIGGGGVISSSHMASNYFRKIFIPTSKKQRDNTKTPPKTSITQRLRTDLGRSVGVTIATHLVWLNRFTGSKPSH